MKLFKQIKNQIIEIPSIYILALIFAIGVVVFALYIVLFIELITG